ncbi:MAG: hypothetical protein IJU98_01635 [Synergistaceae bacterium]|nr:hypothetical protein [Synergistaceae bacterium]
MPRTERKDKTEEKPFSMGLSIREAVNELLDLAAVERYLPPEKELPDAGPGAESTPS